MPRHSTLTNPNDLHYSKIRTFTGDPNGITPDFADQLLTAIDTNKVYRATGTSTGNLIELAPTDGGGDGGSGTSNVIFNAGIAIAPNNLEALLIDTDTNRVYRSIGLNIGDWLELIGGGNSPPFIVDTGYPAIVPSFLGQQYFDQQTGMLFLSKGISSVNDWISISSDPIIDISVSTNYPNLEFLLDSLQYDLYYTANYPQEGFNFSEIVCSVDSAYFTLWQSLRAFGTGYYALVPKPSYNYEVQLIPSEIIVDYSTDREIFAPMNTLAMNLQADSRQISSTVYHFKEFPLRDFNNGSNFVLPFLLDNFS